MSFIQSNSNKFLMGMMNMSSFLLLIDNVLLNMPYTSWLQFQSNTLLNKEGIMIYHS